MDKELRTRNMDVLPQNAVTMEQLYSNNSLRTVHIVFASLFSSLKTPVFNSAGELVSSRIIPLKCVNRDTLGFWMESQFPDGVKKTLINRIFPMLTYELTSMMPDGALQRNPQGYRVRGIFSQDDGIHGTMISTPVSYRFGFKLGVWTNSMQNGLFILDQILPVFVPEVQIKIKENKDLNIVNDVKVQLTDISQDDNYQDVFEKNRILSWTISFNLWANISPSPRAASLIRKVVIDMKDNVNRNLESYIYTGKTLGDIEDLDYLKQEEEWKLEQEDVKETEDGQNEQTETIQYLRNPTGAGDSTDGSCPGSCCTD